MVNIIINQDCKNREEVLAYLQDVMAEISKSIDFGAGWDLTYDNDTERQEEIQRAVL